MTAILTAIGWLILLPILVAIARAEFRGDGVFHYREDDDARR